MKKKLGGLLLSFAVVAIVIAAEKPSAIKKEVPAEFYVYANQGSRLNHYIPSGWMGDFGDLRFNQGSPKAQGDTCIQIKYSAERKQGAGWAGIFWQHPANNWGDKKTSNYNLSGFKKLVFNARGEKGGEYIDKFMVGGIQSQTEEGDSDEVSSDAIELTKEWKTYSIDLKDRDLSHIVGGFGFALNGDSNPTGATFYLDDIRYEK